MSVLSNKMRDIIEIDESLCNGCGQCVTGCAEGALAIVDGKAKLVSDTYCDGLGACLGHCPTGALTVIKRSAPDFDEAAAMEHVRKMQQQEKLVCGCPGSQVRQLPIMPSKNESTVNVPGQKAQLANWPIQLRLVPPQAPFLNNDVLVLAADCTAFTGPAFHQKFCLDGHPMLIACPKLDDVEAYIEKMADIFSINKNIKEIWLPMMSVPCCRGLSYIVQEALVKISAENRIKVKSWIISPEGNISKETHAS